MASHFKDTVLNLHSLLSVLSRAYIAILSTHVPLVYGYLVTVPGLYAGLINNSYLLYFAWADQRV